MKANGKDFAVPLDRVMTLAQRGLGAEMKFNDAKVMAERARMQLEQFKSNPLQAVADPKTAFDVTWNLLNSQDPELRKGVEAAVRAAYEEMSLPEHERESRKLQRERQKFTQEREEFMRQRHAAEVEKKTPIVAQAIDKNITKAFKEVGLPESAKPRFMRIIAGHLQDIWQNEGIEPRDPRAAMEAAHRTKLDMQRYATELLPDDPNEMQTLIGPERAKAIQAALVQQRLKEQEPAPVTAPQTQPASLRQFEAREKRPDEQMTLEQLREQRSRARYSTLK